MVDIPFVATVVLLFPSYCLTLTSKEYFHNLGDNVILLCTLQRETDPIIWRYVFNTTTSIQYSTDNRTNPNFEGISGRLSIVGNYDLQITTIQKNDEGTYQCSSNIGGTFKQHLAILSIVNLVQISEYDFHSLGDNVILFCTLQKETNPIIWRYIFNTTTSIQYSTNYQTNPNLQGISNRLGIVGNYDLQISNIQREDEGRYQCSSNIGGMLREHFTSLSIVIPPSRIYINGSMNNKLEGKEGTDLLIRCIADGGKPPPYVSILNGTRPNNTQEVSYTIPKISRDYHQRSIVCQTTSGVIANPMRTTVQVYLNLKPLTPIFSAYEISTEETIPLVVSCSSYGSRPAAAFTWTIGGNDYTLNSTQSQPVREFNDTYTVTSTLTLSVNKSRNNQSIICSVSNTVGSSSASKTIDVKYAPDISVTSHNYTKNDATRLVRCNPIGNPDDYIFLKWEHKTSYGDLIREFGGNKTLLLPDVPVWMRYQDSGEYICTARNGIKGRDNQIEQTGFGYITMNAQPVFSSDIGERVKQFGEIRKDVDIHVDIYSIPKFTSFKWTRDGKSISTHNSTKYESSSSPTIVKGKFHGKEVQLDGYSVTLTVHGLSTEDFTIYAVTLENEFGNVIYPIILESLSVPETPGNFSTIESTATSLTVKWNPHFGGEYKQLFYIQYRVHGVLEWTTALVGEEDINALKIWRIYKLRNLQEGMAYELRMYAENTAGKRSNVTDVLIVSTKSTESSESNVVLNAVIGGVSAFVIVCGSVTAILVYKWKKGKNNTKKNDTYFENTGFDEIPKGDEYDEIGKTNDLEHKQSNKTYDLLDARHELNVYDDLENPIGGVTSSKSQKAWKTQLKPLNKGSETIELNNMKGST